MPSLIPGLFIPCVISMKSHGHGRDCKIKRMVVQSILLLILEDWEQSWKADKGRATEAREMDEWGTVIIQKKSVKGKSHAFSDQQHETGSKYQKVRAGGLPSPINWWKILTMTAAQNNLGQGKHLLYTVGFRLSLWGSAPDKVESPSWVVPLGLRSWSTSTILSNTKEIISPLININADKHWLFYFTHARDFFPNLAIKTVNFYFAWTPFTYFLIYKTWSVCKMDAVQLHWVHCFPRSRKLWTEKPTKACKQV